MTKDAARWLYVKCRFNISTMKENQSGIRAKGGPRKNDAKIRKVRDRLVNTLWKDHVQNTVHFWLKSKNNVERSLKYVNILLI